LLWPASTKRHLVFPGVGYAQADARGYAAVVLPSREWGDMISHRSPDCFAACVHYFCWLMNWHTLFFIVDPYGFVFKVPL
jgi:hypothetical protein